MSQPGEHLRLEEGPLVQSEKIVKPIEVLIEERREALAKCSAQGAATTEGLFALRHEA